MTDESGYVGINRDGSILLGKNTVADGFEHGREIGIVTHIHSDHMGNFTNALHECSMIFTSRPTFDMLAALHMELDSTVSSDTYFKGRHVYPLDFGKTEIPRKNMRQIDPKKCYSDQITLYQSDHILGTAQVLVVTDDGKRIVYSSDFIYPGTGPIECDILVLDPTHGNPRFNTPIDKSSLENRLVEFVEHEIESGNSITIRAHSGRLQYIMSLLSSGIAENIKFFSHSDNKRLIPVYEKYEMPIREMHSSDTIRGEELMNGPYPFVEFKKQSEGLSYAEREKRAAVFQLGGWGIGKYTLKPPEDNSKRYLLELGDHGTYDGILEYVERCSPQLVITDGSRSKWAPNLAKSITQELGIAARAEPLKMGGVWT